MVSHKLIFSLFSKLCYLCPLIIGTFLEEGEGLQVNIGLYHIEMLMDFFFFFSYPLVNQVS